ncbi:MAG: molybdenum ABC transporter ATP-binding protein [Candidatus Entotheonellia bacterium]
MSAHLIATFEKRFPGGPTIRADFKHPADAFSITVLFGPSGSGKTTILRCLAGLERPEEGSIHFGETLWFDAARGTCLPPQRRGIGYLFQEYALFPHLSVASNIAYGLSGLSKAERRLRVGEILDLVQLTGLEERYPKHLSGGQQQRVALGRALAPRPRLLLLDEPLSALDATMRERLRQDLRRLLRTLGTPTLLVTHDRVEALALGDHVVVLDQGRVCQSGSVHEVFSQPSDAAVARIVGVDTVEPGKILQVADGLATVAVGSVQLVALAQDAGSGDVYACIRAEDVILEKGVATPSSPRNRLAGRIRALSREGPMIRLSLECGFPLTALVTKQACDELELQEGEQVTALIKAPAIHLVPRG